MALVLCESVLPARRTGAPLLGPQRLPAWHLSFCPVGCTHWQLGLRPPGWGTCCAPPFSKGHRTRLLAPQQGKAWMGRWGSPRQRGTGPDSLSASMSCDSYASSACPGFSGLFLSRGRADGGAFHPIYAGFSSKVPLLPSCSSSMSRLNHDISPPPGTKTCMLAWSRLGASLPAPSVWLSTGIIQGPWNL